MAIINNEAFIYVVSEGDTIYSLANKFNSTVELITKVNWLYDPVTDPSLLFPGNVLIIPTLIEGTTAQYIVKPGDTVSNIASNFSTSVDSINALNNLEDINQIYPGQKLAMPIFIYEIAENDTMQSISLQFEIALSDISNANQNRPAYHEETTWAGFWVILPL